MLWQQVHHTTHVTTHKAMQHCYAGDGNLNVSLVAMKADVSVNLIDKS